MSTTYTEEDFRVALNDYAEGRAISRETVFAALRIAAAVMRPGVIEEALDQEQFEDDFRVVAAAIRKAVGATDG